MRKLVAALSLVLAFASMGVFVSSSSLAQQRLIVGADLTWTRATFALNGSSQTLLVATGAGSAARKGFLVVNPASNATVYLSVAGGTATANDIPLSAGTYIEITGQLGPINAVTIIGTSGQSVTVYTGN